MSMTDAPPTPTPPISPEVVVPDLSPTAPPRANPWRDRLIGIGFGLLGVAVFVAFWAFISWRNSDLPGPLDAWNELTTLLSDGFSSSTPNGQGIEVGGGGRLQWSSAVECRDGIVGQTVQADVQQLGCHAIVLPEQPSVSGTSR